MMSDFFNITQLILALSISVLGLLYLIWWSNSCFDDTSWFNNYVVFIIKLEPQQNCPCKVVYFLLKNSSRCCLKIQYLRDRHKRDIFSIVHTSYLKCVCIIYISIMFRMKPACLTRLWLFIWLNHQFRVHV